MSPSSSAEGMIGRLKGSVWGRRGNLELGHQGGSWRGRVSL